jgi:predicted permease
MEVTPEQQAFGTPEWLALQATLLDRVRGLPGVLSASWSTMSPLSGRDRGAGIRVAGFVPQGPRDDEIHVVSISPGYFDTFGIRLVAGRQIALRDSAGAQKVVVLNETAARFYFGDANAIGKRVTFAKPGDPGYEVVGIVADVRHDSLRSTPWRFAYLAIPQSIDRINRLALAVRTTGDAGALSAEVQREVLRTGPSLLITNVSTMDRQVEISLMRERLVSTLSVAFGCLALVLACIGLYGLLAYAVARRTNELGIRMALGATRGSTLWLVLREALTLCGAGIVIAVPALVALGRTVQVLLYEVKPFDMAAVSGSAAVLLVSASLAAALPARRASRLDPMAALRSE